MITVVLAACLAVSLIVCFGVIGFGKTNDEKASAVVSAMASAFACGSLFGLLKLYGG